MGKRQGAGREGFTLIELMIVLAIIGILAALSIANFRQFQARSRQSEVKANLKAIFTAEKAFRGERQTYSSYFSEIGFVPERGNRYAYYLGSSAVESRNGPKPVDPGSGLVDAISADTFALQVPALPAFAGTPVGTLGGQQDAFTATAAADLDGDPAVDSWEISSLSAAHKSGCGNEESTVVAGVPFNDYNDVTCQ